jgi:hypothetical protein
VVSAQLLGYALSMRKRFALAACAVTLFFVAPGLLACPPSKPDAFVVSKVLASDPRIDVKMDDTFSLSRAIIDVPTRQTGEFAQKLRATLGGAPLRRVDDGALDDPLGSGPGFEVPDDPARFDGAVLALSSGGRVVARFKVDFEKGSVHPCVVDFPPIEGRPKSSTDHLGAPRPIVAPASAVPAPLAGTGAARSVGATDKPKSSGCAFVRAGRERSGAGVTVIALATLLLWHRRRPRSAGAPGAG